MKIGRKVSSFWQQRLLKVFFLKSPREKSLCHEACTCAWIMARVWFVITARFNVLAIIEIMENCWMLLSLRL